jgi:hypothetical protein
MHTAPSPQGIFITRDELEATRGLSDLSVRLYWRLRSLMDFSTGVVGKHRRISYQSLREDCEVLTPKGLGHQRTQPSLRSLRTALEGLERAGLVEASGPLVFSLALAQKLQVRPNQTRHEPDRVAFPANPYAARDSGQTRHDETAERVTPLSIKKSNVYTSTAARAPGPVDNSAGRIAADFLNLLSKKLGYPIAHKHGDPKLAQWVESGLTFDALETAVRSAKEARQRDGNPAPLNPGFIASFLGQPDDWRATWSGIVAKGKALGIEQQAGEQCPSFKYRVFQAAGEEVAA